MYTIGEVSEMFGLPVSTLRYYDKQGLFPEITRVSGIRKFSERELESLRVIECLKKAGMEIKDMGQLDLERAEEVAGEIEGLLRTEEFQAVSGEEEEKSDTKWVCEVCGYVHTGETPPEKCPLCGVPKDRFYRQ